MADKPFTFEVSNEEAGQKLLQCIRRRLGGNIPQSAIMRWIRTGQVRVDRGRSKPFTRLESGQRIRIPPFRESQPDIPHTTPDVPPDIVHEDDTLLILNKPSGLAVHGGSKTCQSVYSWISERYRVSSWKPTPVHRIDRDTCGLLVVAKSYHMLLRLQQLWKNKEVTKLYLAWVSGRIGIKGWHPLISSLSKKMHSNGERVVSDKQGKHALCYVKKVAKQKNQTLLAVSLHTGRTHQIRVQLADEGTPIIGDRKYGSKSISSSELLLCSWYIAWDDVSFEASVPWNPPFQIPQINVQQLLKDYPQKHLRV